MGVTIQIKRVYDEPAPDDGVRALVDRLWPRGVPKEALPHDVWAKDITPSPELRQWFDHDPARFDEFARRYRDELRDARPACDDLLSRAGDGALTLLYAAKDPAHNHALVLREHLLSLIASGSV